MQSTTAPQYVRVDSFMGIWGAAAIVLPMGAVFVLASQFVMGAMLRQLQQRQASREQPQQPAEVASD
ncbi:MAG: hypothetical protein WD118_06450 [Phycisphaeraceae bacterium]